MSRDLSPIGVLDIMINQQMSAKHLMIMNKDNCANTGNEGRDSAGSGNEGGDAS